MSKLYFITHNSKLLIPALLLWQLVSVYLMAVGVWPVGLAWVNLGLIILFILLVPAFEGLLLVVASIPFYIVLPSHYSETLSMWRVAVGVLFLKAILSVIPEFLAWQKYPESSINFKMDSGQPSQSVVASGMTERKSFGSRLKSHVSSLYTYEKIAIILFILGILSLALARYPLRGASQLIFLLNTSLLYPVVVWTVKNREQLIRILKYGALSTGTIIAIGYIQFIATLFSTAYYFWQYWALKVANLYYGWPLAKVLLYSNSWVTVNGEEKTLRMFSIMPSSHAFAMVCVFFLACALPLLLVRDLTGRLNHAHWKLWVWVSVVLACLALIFSGTRGVWTGMVPALAIVAVLYHRKRWHLDALVTPIYAAMLVVVILFTASPLIDVGVGWIRNVGQRTLDRVTSIVDTSETSNAGRLAMWQVAGKYALLHPFGVGYGNFVVTLNPASNSVSFNEAANQENKLYNLPQRYITAHSLYLQLLVELSVVGLILFGLFWLAYCFEVWKYFRGSVSGSSSASWRIGEVSLSAVALAKEGRGMNESIPPLTPPILGGEQIPLLVETVYVATISIVFLWFLAYSVFDLTWLNDKILLYTFIALGLVRVALNYKTNKTVMTNK